MSIRTFARGVVLSLLVAGAGCQVSGPQPVTRGEPVLWEPTVDEPLRLTPATSAQRRSADRLQVLSFNMQHRDRPEQLAAMAQRLRNVEGTPDFILCQEVLFKRSKWRGAENTAAVLADELGLYVRGTKRKENREGVAIISRYAFEYYDELHLKARTPLFLLGFRRVSVMGEFQVPDLGRVRVVAVHFAHWPTEGHVRRRQLDETLAWVAERQRHEPADVTVLGGDFNMTPGAREFAPLANPVVNRGLVWLDLNGSDPTRGSFGKPTKRIDYIFVAAPGLDAEFHGESLLFLDGLWRQDGSGRFVLSDHVPVRHEYSFRPPAVAQTR